MDTVQQLRRRADDVDAFCLLADKMVPDFAWAAEKTYIVPHGVHPSGSAPLQAVGQTYEAVARQAEPRDAVDHATLRGRVGPLLRQGGDGEKSQQRDDGEHPHDARWGATWTRRDRGSLTVEILHGRRSGFDGLMI